MNNIETMKLALEALDSDNPDIQLRAAIALRQAIEQAQQAEPVAVWELFADGWDSIADPEWMETLPVGTKLYTSPPPRQPLTDEQIAKEFYKFEAAGAWYQFARAIEAAHGIKE